MLIICILKTIYIIQIFAVINLLMHFKILPDWYNDVADDNNNVIDSTPSQSHGSGNAPIAVIVCLVLVVLLLVSVGFFLWRRKKRRGGKQKSFYPHI